MTQIIFYLNFNGQCREAMNFYKDCLGGELALNTLAGSPMEAQMPAEMKDYILHAQLTKDKLILMGSDMMGRNVVRGTDATLMLNCSSEEEMNTFFDKLSQGANIRMKPQPAFWGAIFAELTDKYGRIWMLTYDKTMQ